MMKKMMKKTAVIGTTAAMALTAFSGMVSADTKAPEEEQKVYFEGNPDFYEDPAVVELLKNLGIELEEANINTMEEMPEGVEFTEHGELDLDNGNDIQNILQTVLTLADPDMRTAIADDLLSQADLGLTDEEMNTLLTKIHDMTFEDVKEMAGIVVETVTDPEFLAEVQKTAVECAMDVLEKGGIRLENALLGYLTADDEALLGGWDVTDEQALTEEDLKVFEAAAADLTDAEYTPIALLGTQLVAGKNYCFLCEVKDGENTDYQLVYIYEDLNGNAQVTEVSGMNADVQ